MPARCYVAATCDVSYVYSLTVPCSLGRGHGYPTVRCREPCGTPILAVTVSRRPRVSEHEEQQVERVLNWLCVHPDNPLRTFMLGYYVAAAVGAVAASGLYLAGVNWVYVFLALLVAATMPVVVPIVAFVTLPYVRSVRQIRRGDHWAHWQYTDDEWARYGQHKHKQATRLMKLSPLFAAALGLVTGGIAWLASRDLRTALLLFGILLGVGLLVSAQLWLEGRAHSRRVKSGDVYISPDGVLRPQGYLPLSAFNVRLVDVIVEPTASGVTVMRFKVGSVTENLVTRVSEFDIPVPTGRDAEAQTLAKRLLNGG